MARLYYAGCAVYPDRGVIVWHRGCPRMPEFNTLEEELNAETPSCVDANEVCKYFVELEADYGIAVVVCTGTDDDIEGPP